MGCTDGIPPLFRRAGDDPAETGSDGMTQRDDIGEAIIHVREYRSDDPVALEYWARMLAAEVERLRAAAGRPETHGCTDVCDC